MESTTQQKNDIFADIAAQRIVYRDKNLVEPKPIPTPQRHLQTKRHNLRAAIQPPRKLSTAKQLASELAKQRKRYRKFLCDQAPAIPDTRSRKYLSRFQWRQETPEDRADMTTVLSGKGQWETVSVPHYGGPLGKAVTYYRTTVNFTQADLKKGAVFICFKGVDYKAHVFFNNTYVGSHEGFFAPFEFDVTDQSRSGQNVLVVKVENDYICGSSMGDNMNRYSGDKIYAATGLGYDDPQVGWHHCPPGMGIYQDVYLESRPRVSISDVFVRPIIDENRAEAWIEVWNCDIQPKQIMLDISVFGQNFKQTVIKHLRVTPSNGKTIGLGDAYQEALARSNGTLNQHFPLLMEGGINRLVVNLPIDKMRLWDTETPWLYQFQVRLLDEGKTLIDAGKQQFGMRSFAMDTKNSPKGFMELNHKPIRLRGANTMGHEQQCVFKKDWDQLIDDILLAKICNMNFWRLTQRPVQKEVYEYCDKLGLMTQTDLPTFGVLRYNQYFEALRQAGEMEKLIRPHPCAIMISYMNEPSINSGDKPHRNLNRDELTEFFESADKAVHILNPDRVIKAVDGDYDPPAPGLPDRHCYPCWYNGQGLDLGKLHRGYWQPVKPGWYFGCGEFGAEGLEDAEIMYKYYPKSWLPKYKDKRCNWSPNQIVDAQTGKFHYFFYETPNTLNDWIRESQEHQAWATRFMTEAFRRENRMNTFAIHLFIDAFPSGWMKTIMDCERRPKKAFFAYRDALEPVLPTVRTDRFTYFDGETMKLDAWVSNDLPHKIAKATLHYQLEEGAKVIFANKAPITISACQSEFCGTMNFKAPAVTKRTKLTVRLAVIQEGKIVNHNTLEIEVYPKPAKSNTSSVSVLGRAKGPAARLAAELGIKTKTTGIISARDTLLIDDFDAFSKRQKEILAAVNEGAKAVFLELAPGQYSLAGKQVCIKPSSFNPMHFVARNTGHRFVEGFGPKDFRLWYDPAADCIMPILENTFTAKDFVPILTSGNLNDKGQWDSALAAGECNVGKGTIIINNVKLAGRTQHNPVATQFAMKLLTQSNI